MTQKRIGSPAASSPGRKPLARFRLFLVGSAAGIAMSAAAVGLASFSHAFYAATGPAVAQAAPEDGHGPTGFADLVAKVKPAMVSVRVSIADPAKRLPSPRGLLYRLP